MTAPQLKNDQEKYIFETAAVGICQLTHIDEMGLKNSWFIDKLQYLIRKFRYYRRNISICLPNKRINDLVLPGTNQRIRPGDLVRVCSVREIQQTLDKSRKTNGCTFQSEMYGYCGKEFKVYKKVQYIYNETKRKMVKCRGVYLLEGTFCSGKTAYLKNCDRNCFFFWQKSWLRKV